MHRTRHRIGHLAVGAGDVAQRTMRLDVRHLAALGARAGIQRTDLVDEHGLKFESRNIHSPSAKAL